MDERFSFNVQNMQISGIRRFYNKVSKYPDAISLTLGQPNFDVPLKIKNAMVKAITENKTQYTSNAGLIELRTEISKYLSRMKISYAPEEICITVGGSEGLMDVFQTLLNPNDKVLIPTPAYPAYESCVMMAGAKTINYLLNEDFSIDFDKLDKIINIENPKAIVVSYPSNPTGAVLTREDRDRLYEILKDKNIFIITDEMYSSICFKEYYSIAQMEKLKNKTIAIGGFSKIFSMTGLRIGYVCASEYIMKEIMKVHQYNVSCAPSISQYGAIEGLKYCEDDVKIMINEFVNRRNYIFERLTAMGIEVNKPEGAFYIFPNIKKFNFTSEEFSEKLLYEARLAVVPGSAFGVGGEGFIRISYAYSMDEINEGLNRFEKWIYDNR